jgi:hypothetical protein
MSDRYHSLTVVLENDLRSEDDAKAIMDAIRVIRGVASVTGVVANFESHMAQERVRLEIGKQLIGICFPGKESR